MADEEQGFTFVDKRRAAAEAPPQSASPPSMDTPVSVPDLAADTPDFLSEMPAEDAQTGPSDIYSIMGYCLSILASEAWQKLGLIADQQTGEAHQDLTQAKAAIDAAGDLAARLENAPAEFVPEGLKRDLRTLLQDLRLNYVSQQGQSIAS